MAGFMRRNGRLLLSVSFCLFIILQQIAVRYRSSMMESMDEHGNDKVAVYEINQLEKLWKRTQVDDLISPEKIADLQLLERGRLRLKEAEESIRKSEKRVGGIKGEKQELFKKAHGYYHHSVTTLLAIIDF